MLTLPDVDTCLSRVSTTTMTDGLQSCDREATLNMRTAAAYELAESTAKRTLHDTCRHQPAHRELARLSL
eukprot:7371010-Prorocentrum_lima.AAC.1